TPSSGCVAADKLADAGRSRIALPRGGMVIEIMSYLFVELLDGSITAMRVFLHRFQEDAVQLPAQFPGQFAPLLLRQAGARNQGAWFCGLVFANAPQRLMQRGAWIAERQFSSQQLVK